MEIRLGLFFIIISFFFHNTTFSLYINIYIFQYKLLFGMEDTEFYNDDVFQTMTITPRAFPQMDLLDVRVKKQKKKKKKKKKRVYFYYAKKSAHMYTYIG